MIKHIVFWKLAEEALGGSKLENAARIKQLAEGLVDTVPFVRELEVGLDIEGSPAAWDVALYSTFDSVDDLAEYQVHPAHQEVAAIVKQLTVERAVVDYEV